MPCQALAQSSQPGCNTRSVGSSIQRVQFTGPVRSTVVFRRFFSRAGITPSTDFEMFATLGASRSLVRSLSPRVKTSADT